MAFTRFITAAIEDRPITLYGNGLQTRDFTFVEDIVRANILAAERPTPPGSVFNVAGGSNVSVNDVIEIIGQLSGRPLRVVREASVKGDVDRTAGSTDAISDALGWSPIVDLAAGLQKHIDWRLSTTGGGPT
jgi:nucleoside-diphosphate-sugar epimerase